MVQSSSNVYYRDEAALNLISQLMEQNKDNHGNIKLISDRLDTLENSNLLSVSGISDNYHIKIDENKAIQSFLEEGSDELLGGGPVEGFIFNNISYLNINTKTTISHVSDVAGVIEGEIIKSSMITGEILSFNTKKYLHLSTGGLRGTNNQNKGITVTSDGRVGIGIVEPEEDLEIDGSIQIDSANVARLKFQQSGQNPHALGEIDALGDGDGGALIFYTKINGQHGISAVTEKIRINNLGAISINGDSNYGNPGQVLSSNGDNAVVSWTDAEVYTGGIGVTIDENNEIKIGQSVGEDDDVTFLSSTITQNINVGGNITGSTTSNVKWGSFGTGDLHQTCQMYVFNHEDQRTGLYLEGNGIHLISNEQVNGAREYIYFKGPLSLTESEKIVFANGFNLQTVGPSINYRNSGNNGFSQLRQIFFQYQDQDIFAVTQNGDIQHRGSDFGTQYTTYSDDRLKHNESNITNGLEVIRLLHPQKYQKTKIMLDENYNGDLNDYEWFWEAGFIAQDILTINDISYSVTHGDYYDAENNLIKAPYGLNYNNIFTYTTSAVKELDTIVQQQRDLIDNLRAENETIKAALNELLTESGRENI